MKRAWETRRANAAAQADEEVEPVENTTPAAVAVPVPDADTSLPTETGAEKDAEAEAHLALQLDVATQADVASEPDVAVVAESAPQPEVALQPDLATRPEVAARPDLTPPPVLPVSTADQQDLVAAWTEHPVCLCGCGEELPRPKPNARQSLFRVGHDSRLKSLAARVIKGAASRDQIPAIARAFRDRIGFLRTRPELAAAF